MPTSREIEPLLEIDRNTRKLEVFLAHHTPVLTIADMKRFMPCTINVDPYLRKLIKGQATAAALAEHQTTALVHVHVHVHCKPSCT